jgi:regulator of replication initiation timing
MKPETQIGFLENQVDEMSNRMKNLEYDLSEMTVENNQLRERVTKLATRLPSWPKGYRPQGPQWANKHNNKS